MISTLILLTTQPIFYHSLLSLTNLPYTVYLFLGAVYIYLWDKKKQIGYLILSALFASLSTWTRSVEPFWLGLLLVVFLVSVFRKKIWNILIFSIFFFPIHEAWKVFQGSLTSTGTSTVAEIIGYTGTIRTQFDVSRWIQVAVYLYKYIVIPWGAIFIAFILATMSMLILKKNRKLFLIFLLTYTLLGVFVTGSFVFRVGYAGTFASGDAPQRLSMLFYPLFVYCIALVLQSHSIKKV